MRCYKCGAELTEGTRFCSYCGVEIGKEILEEPKMVQEPFADKIKAMFIGFWNGLDGFCKVTTVGIVVVVILLFISVCTQKGLSIFFSVIQLVGFIIAIFMHKNIIRLEAKKKWIKYIVLLAAILFSVINIMSYSWGKDKTANSDITYKVQVSDSASDAVTPAITTIKSPYKAEECVGQIYSIIENDFIVAGFTNIKIEKVEDLKFVDADKVNTVASVSVNGKIDFTNEQKFDKNDEVIITYHTYEKCKVKIHVDFIPNLIFSKYDVNLLIDGIDKGTMEHGTDKDFEFTIDPGEYTITFESNESSYVKGEVKLNVECDIEVSYKISCYSDKVSVDIAEGINDNDEKESIHSEEIDVPKIIVAMSEDEFIGMLYTDAEAKFREMGFTVFEYEALETEDINKPDDTIGAVEIKSWAFGNGNFTVGDTYDSDAIVVLWYYVCNEPEPNLTVNDCPELAEMLANKSEIDNSYSVFATKYKGRIIEFDGRIDYCTKHENYNTRFDYLVSAGDYNPDHQTGPVFKFEDVSYYDLNTDLDTVSVGMNVHIVAEVVSFNSNNGLFYLEPVSVTGR